MGSLRKAFPFFISLHFFKSINNERIFICGDCADGTSIGALKTAYVAEEQGIVAADNVLKIIQKKGTSLTHYPIDLYGNW